MNRLRAGAVGTVTLSIDGGTRHVGFARVSKGGDLLPGSASATPVGRREDSSGVCAPLRDHGRVRRAASGVLREGCVRHDPRVVRPTYKGLPVFGGMLRAHFDTGNKLTAVNGTFVPQVDLHVDPRLTASQAAQKAIADVVANPPRTEENADAAAPEAPTGLRAASTTLEVYRMGLVRDVPGSNQLVYEVEVTNGADVRDFVFVHANTGKIVNRYSGVQSALFRGSSRRTSTTRSGRKATPSPGA